MTALIEPPASGTSDPDASDRAPDGPSWKQRRDESGLTTLEWLLIVAAVAGIAALAVVLVTNVVGDTSEQISGSSARRTALVLAADEISQDAAAAQKAATTNETQNQFANPAAWKSHYDRKCSRLRITYGDVGATIAPHFSIGTTSLGGWTGTTTVSALTGYDPDGTGTAAAGAAHALCQVV